MSVQENKLLITDATNLLKRVNMRTISDVKDLANNLQELLQVSNHILDDAGILEVLTVLDKYKIVYFDVIAQDGNDSVQMQYGWGFVSNIHIDGEDYEANNKGHFEELQSAISGCRQQLLLSWSYGSVLFGDEFKVSKSRILSQYEDRYGKDKLDKLLANYEAGIVESAIMNKSTLKNKSLKV